MGIKPRTIDNLGIDASNQYAKGQEARDSGLIRESYLFRAPTEGGLNPYIPAGGEESFTVFTMGRASAWAGFSAPRTDTSYQLFTYSFIPSIGTSEQLQALDDKLETLEKKIRREQERDYKKLRSFIKHLINSSRTFELIKSRLNQYQRG